MRREYILIGEILRQLDEELYTCTAQDFIRLCMLKSRGSMNPAAAEQIYCDLMAEAGLPPLYEDMKDEK